MIKSLTSLRGIFILFIFLHHAGIYQGGGTMGVAFFFVLSGFSMTLGYHDRVLQSDFNYRQYLTRRCIKFYPLHWITLIADIPYVLMGVLNWWLIPLFFVNAALLQTLVPIQEVYFSYNAVSWFLADILFFAVVFPFVFRFIKKTNSKIRLLVALTIAIIYVVIALMVPDSYRHAILYISPFIRILDFVFGICLGLVYLRIKNDRKIDRLTNSWGGQKSIITLIALLLILLLVVESCILGSYGFVAPLYWIPIAVLILLVSVQKVGVLKVFENKTLLWLGECSFTIFLIHRLVLRYAAMFKIHESKIIYVAICFVITIVVSYLVERYLLTPITQWLTKRNQQFMTARS
jgi:peptidoglycan/LPS O-acetylase OafA/YrhL